MAIIGSDGNKSEDSRKSKRNKILLASAILLALLSLLIFLGNPGLWTPQDNDEPQAEAVDDDVETTDDNNTSAEPVDTFDNSTQVGTAPSLVNGTSSGVSGNDDNDSGRSGSSSYVIIFGNSNATQDNRSGGRGGSGGGGGGGSSDSSNRSPSAENQQVSTDEDTSVALQLQADDPDGDDLEYAVVNGPSHGTLVGFSAETGAAQYVPGVNYNGADSFTFEVNDGRGKNDVATVSIVVNPSDDAPFVINSTNAITDEDIPVDIDLMNAVADPDGISSVAITNMTQPSHGTAVLVNNTVTYTPEPNYNGQDSFTFQATDGTLTSNTGNVTITINPVNDAPVALNITVSTLEDTPVDLMVVNGTSDVDGDVSSLVLIQLPSQGVITISADNNTITYSPNENFEGSDSFLYLISDSSSNSTGSVDITVIGVNDAPTIVDGALGSISLDEDGSIVIDIISNVFDPEGDTVTITNVTQPSHGTVILNPDNTVTYTPDPNFNGEDSFEFTVDDGNGGQATGTVTITVGPVNDVPESNGLAATTDEDTGVEILLNSTDADGDPILFTLVQGPIHGTTVMLDSSSGLVQYTPDPNYNGPDSFTFQATDGVADSNIATVSITVNPVNDDPTANNDNFLGVEDTPLAVDVLANDLDPEGDSLTVDDLPSQPSHGTAVINGDSTITYTPELDFNGTDSFEYSITDGNGGSATGLVTVTVGGVNDAPDSDNGAAIANEDSSTDILLNATDTDGDVLTYSIISTPTHGSIEIISGDGSLVRYSPTADFNGNDAFTFQATDGVADSNIAAVAITVNPVNDDPTANNDNFMVQEDTPFAGNVLANDIDIDGDTLSASVVKGSSTAHGNLTFGADGTFSYIPEADYNGPDSFQYELSDGNGGLSIATAMITVTQVNDAPVGNDDSAYTTISQPVLVRVLENDSDFDSATLNVGSVGAALHGTVTIRPDGKAVVYTPEDGFAGFDEFTYSVTDGSLSDTATVQIKIYNIKFGHLQPPVGGGGDHEFEQGSTASVRLELTDVDGNDIVNATIILRVQEIDSNNVPIGPVFNATSAGGSNDGNLFKYSNSFYQYNLKTEDMTPGKWALYVYMIDDSTSPAIEVLLEDPPIDGISTTIIVK